MPATAQTPPMPPTRPRWAMRWTRATRRREAEMRARLFFVALTCVFFGACVIGPKQDDPANSSPPAGGGDGGFGLDTGRIEDSSIPSSDSSVVTDSTIGEDSEAPGDTSIAD